MSDRLRNSDVASTSCTFRSCHFLWRISEEFNFVVQVGLHSIVSLSKSFNNWRFRHFKESVTSNIKWSVGITANGGSVLV